MTHSRPAPEGEARIALFNRQRKLALPMAWLRRFAPVAHALVLESPLGQEHDAPLAELEEVEVTFVSDATIARLHVEFMAIEGATDVITFQHGEIVISTETAAAYAPLYGRTLRDELALYLIHGLLHLHGYGDGSALEAAAMHRLQEQLLARALQTTA